MNSNIARVAAALLVDYSSVYYIEPKTGYYEIYSTTRENQRLELQSSGKDFFEDGPRTIQTLVLEEDRESVSAALSRESLLSHFGDKDRFSITYRLLTDGQPVYHTMRVLRDATEDGECVILGIQDVDEVIRSGKRSIVFSQVAESLARQYGMIYYIDTETDDYFEFTSSQEYRNFNINPSGSDFFVTSQKNVPVIIHPDDQERVFAALDKNTMLEAMKDGGTFTMTYRLMLAGGSSYTRMSVFWASDHRHLIMGMMDIDSEVKREKEIAKKLYLVNEKVYRDEMTGVKNKNAFQEREEAMQEQIRQGKLDEFAVVVCDLNGLKAINDTYGHKAGDEYIIKACRMICEIFQHSPVFRLGGDEFAAILTGRDYLIRKELVLALHDRSVENIGTENVVISGGYSDFRPGEDTSFHDVFVRADAQMYEEKQLLKGMGAVTRDAAIEAFRPIFVSDENTEILRLKRSILIVEDEEINRDILGDILEESFDLLYAADGVEALEQIKKHIDDLALVLLDLQMPRMNGMEVLKVMKGEKELSEIPVIVMTADQSAEVDCLKIGAIDFIPKPYPAWEVIHARVNRCIELSEKRNIIETTERDSLTNLFNHDYFIRYVRMYDQHYADMSMDAMVLDINHFHVLNERYGKQYGDSVLARLGGRIRQISRDVGGIGCRRGADTFMIYCPHREDYESILEKASEGLAGEDASENRVRLRMGVYSIVDKTLEIERRFDFAKIAANSVKNSFRMAVGLYDEKMHEAELYRARLLEDFKPSLEGNHFTVYFQPKFDIRPEIPLLSSAEALVRWNHPELGMISPGVFIPLLEDNGLILDLDYFVWREAAARIRDWKDRLGYSVPVSVNVSRIDMLTPNLKSVFMDILEEFDLDSDDLVLEITESAYTGDSDQVISTAKELRGMGMGFRIEMDDFGTGYSSLGMLAHLPIDALKLDMSFVRSAFGENRDVRMIELIIDIADYLHVPVVAEGVETEEQYLTLKAMGCDQVQGYYFSKPVPPQEFDRFILERSKAKAEPSPETKKTYMSISKALISDFESIFYLDVVTDYYLEFFREKNGRLKIRPGGTNFYGDAREKLLANVRPEDVPRLREVTEKANLIQLAEQEETFSISYSKMEKDAEIPYLLQTIKTRESDHHHIVIGVRQA